MGSIPQCPNAIKAVCRTGLRSGVGDHFTAAGYIPGAREQNTNITVTIPAAAGVGLGRMLFKVASIF